MLCFLGWSISRCRISYSIYEISANPVQLVGQLQLVNLGAIRRFLFEQTQHRIGGFGKTPGSPPGPSHFPCCSMVYSHASPDIYHSCLGLAALATVKEPGLKALDPALCISLEQRAKIDKLRNEVLGRI